MPAPSLTLMHAHIVLSGPCWPLLLQLPRPQLHLTAPSCCCSITTLHCLQLSRHRHSPCSGAYKHTTSLQWSPEMLSHALTHVHIRTHKHRHAGNAGGVMQTQNMHWHTHSVTQQWSPATRGVPRCHRTLIHRVHCSVTGPLLCKHKPAFL